MLKKMKRPEKLETLIEELKGESVISDVETTKTSKAVVFINNDAAENDDGIDLNAEECLLVFANLATVERLMEALDDPDDASLVLVDVKISHKVLDHLERSLSAIDEG
jgi:hypothetical protein